MRCQRLTDDPPLHRGERLSHAAYEQYKGSLTRAAATYGYLDARMLRSEMQVDLATHKANITCSSTAARAISSAPRHRAEAVRDSQVRRFLRYTKAPLQRARAAAHAIRAR